MHLWRKDNEVPLNLVNGQISKEMDEEEKTLEEENVVNGGDAEELTYVLEEVNPTSLFDKTIYIFFGSSSPMQGSISSYTFGFIFLFLSTGVLILLL